MRGALAFLLLAASPARATCPTSEADWKAWGMARIADFFRVAPSDTRLSTLKDAVTACDPRLPARPSRVRRCLANLSAFAIDATRTLDAGHSMGLTITDEEYFTRVPFKAMLELPRELTDPEFLKILDDDARPDYVDRALNRIREANPSWIAFPYRSQHLPTVDETDALGRLLVYVPGNDYDQYLQFGLRHDLALPRPHAASIVAIQKRGVDGKVLDEPQAWLNDLWRVRDGKTGAVTRLSTRYEVRGFLENCHSCHKHPLLAIAPVPFPMTDAAVFNRRFGDAIRTVNRHMEGYPSLRYPHMPVAAFGPGLGPVRKRDDAFLKACAGDRVTAPDRLAAVGAAMRCARCHDGERRGALTFPSAQEPLQLTGKSLVEHYVVGHRKMPPGATLDASERSALVDCLRKEYYEDFRGKPGLLKIWLLQERCWAE